MPLPFTGAELRRLVLDFLAPGDVLYPAIAAVRFVVQGRSKSGRPVILKRRADMALQLTIDQEADYEVAFLNSAGRPATVQGVPIWRVVPDGFATITPAADGMSAVLSAGATVGSGTVEVRADADRGEGVREIIGLDSFAVVEGDATVVQLTAGAPRPKTPPPTGPSA